MALGWIAVFYAALYMGGGHPPMSGYVGMFVIVASWILGSLGLVCGLFALRGNPPRLGLLFVLLNAALLGVSIVILFM